MCLLAFYAAGVMPDPAHLEMAAENNPDGFGYAIITARNNLLIRRNMDAEQLISKFLQDRNKHRGPALWHARIGTSGTKTLGNCHPFIVGRDHRTVLAHNGVLFRPPVKESRSDTSIFASSVFPVTYRRIDAPAVRRRLERQLGGNKVVLLTTNRKYRRAAYIFNEQLGEWEDGGAWMSNSSYRVARRKYTQVSYSYRSKNGVSERSYDGGKTWVPDTPLWGGYYDRAEKKGTKYGWCRWCKTQQVVDPYTHICTNCHVCGECGEWRRKCVCDLVAS